MGWIGGHLRYRCVVLYTCTAFDETSTDGAGIFLRWTNQTQSTRVCSHDGPIRLSRRGCVLTEDRSDALSSVFDARGAENLGAPIEGFSGASSECPENVGFEL
eukprot:1183015-Prorocentrum_minimum.AAC.1